MAMQFNKETIARLAEQARTGPQKKISVDLKRVKKEAMFLQKQYEHERTNGPVSVFDFTNKWESAKETKYLYQKVRSLTKIIASGQFDPVKFEFMMRMGQMVERGRMREFDASVAIGQKFANEYVAPTVQDTPPDSDSASAASGGGNVVVATAPATATTESTSNSNVTTDADTGASGGSHE